MVVVLHRDFPAGQSSHVSLHSVHPRVMGRTPQHSSTQSLGPSTRAAALQLSRAYRGLSDGKQTHRLPYGGCSLSSPGLCSCHLPLGPPLNICKIATLPSSHSPVPCLLFLLQSSPQLYQQVANSIFHGLLVCTLAQTPRPLPDYCQLCKVTMSVYLFHYHTPQCLKDWLEHNGSLLNICSILNKPPQSKSRACDQRFPRRSRIWPEIFISLCYEG